jgi:hypothetical protein
MGKLICRACGHTKVYFGTASSDERCEICNKKMYPQKENEGAIVEQLVNEDKDHYTIEDVLKMDLIRSMENTIKSVGHKRTWESIERITNAKQRIIFRQGFFKAGGIR